jgi:hypothetical protein
MRIRRILSLTIGLFLFACGTAAAQEPGKTGVTMAYPGAIGIIWHATDKVAIRPDFSFSHSSVDSSSSSTTSSGWTLGMNISALFYIAKYENVRTYVSPRFSYNRTHSTVNQPASQFVLPEITTTTSTTGGGGSFGAQYSPTPRFSVFGEVGLSFSHRETKPGSATIPGGISANGWGTGSGVGVIFYF